MAFPIQVSLDPPTMAVVSNFASSVGNIAEILQADTPVLAEIDTGLIAIATALLSIAKAINAQQTTLAGIEAALAIIAESTAPPFKPPTQLVLGVPILTRKGKIVPMPNTQLPNDAIMSFPILTENANGVMVPAPTGDTYSLSAVAPQLNAVIGTATFPPAASPTPSVNVNALVALSNPTNSGGSLTFTLNDSAGLKPFISNPIDIVADATPAELAEGGGIITGSQAVPTAPGP